ncbi:hypothetical protein [Sphingobium sp. Leaf26]|nr:hypothetical protein [Sphingobium sp. Leaf26]
MRTGDENSAVAAITLDRHCDMAQADCAWVTDIIYGRNIEKQAIAIGEI